ncbi:MAG: rhomboid family intramembrane serine protease [Alphaproteobacteria bacterium]|nr:rhomboid family intramembrane serine protease [Alphaproteobacteria bacterium]
MFLPIGDFPNPKGYVAWVTWLLIAANVAVYLLISLPLTALAPDPADPALRAYVDAVAHQLPPGVTLQDFVRQLSAYDLFVFEHGFKPGAPAVDDLFASLFLHGGLGHLAGNMLFLWIYGDNVEHRLGRVPYLLAYLLTGVCATLAFAALDPGSMVPLVGASGAISGVLGFYFLLFPRNVVKVFVALFPILFRTIHVNARIVLGVFVVIDNLLPLLGGAGGGVAYGAHLGGFLAGLGLAWLGERAGWRRPGGEPRDDGAAALRDARRGASPEQLARARLQMGLSLMQQGQPVAAYHHLVSAAELAPGTETARQAEAALRALTG